MELTEKLLVELQNRLKVGNRRGVHLNAIPARSRYKFDLTRLSYIDEKLPYNFVNSLLTELPLKFKITWKDNVPDLNSLFEEDQTQLVKITKSFENLINQTDAIESEKGINTFGFGFPILVRRDQADDKLTLAPILIWSLKIKRTKEFNTWEVQRNEDDPIYINEVLINHLFNDSKVEVKQLSSEHLDDGLIDKDELLDICVSILESINSDTPSDLREVFEKKLGKIVQISERKHYESLPLTSNNAFIEFGGLFSIFEVQKQNIIHDYTDLMELKGLVIDRDEMDRHFFQPISSIETDPSQQGILHSLKSSRNILIQGPPGTGKSQTLTAILVNALENRKKTIVVCEKRTALEVLQNSLYDKGLNYQCILIKDIIKDRKTAVDSVRERVDNSSYRSYRYLHSRETLDNIIDKLEFLIYGINKKHKKVGEKLIGDKNWTDVVGELLTQLKDNDEEYDLEIQKENFSYDAAELSRILELIRKGQSLYEGYKPYEEFSFLDSSKLKGDNPFEIEQQIEEDFKKYKYDLNIIKNNIVSYKEEYFKVRRNQFIKQEKRLRSLISKIKGVFENHNSDSDIYNDEKIRGSLYKLLALFSGEKKRVLKDYEKISSEYKQLKIESTSSPDYRGIMDAKTNSDRLDCINDYEEYLNKINVERDSIIEEEFNGFDLLEEIDYSFKTETLETLRLQLKELKEKIENDNWAGLIISNNSHKELIDDVEELIGYKDSYFNHDVDIFSLEFKWFDFYNNLAEIDKQTIKSLKGKKDWKKIFLIFYLNTLLVKTANSDLPTSDNDHIELAKTQSHLEKEQIKYIKEYWFSKQIDSTREFDAKHPSLAVENLYNKRASNRYRRLSLREIVKLDTDLFTTFFPIILTTPDVASNLFKGKNKYFDLVMFDEASQLKLEDTLPALLKGKQIIVAGDEHQMPPSNYFSKIFEGTLDDEDEFEDEIEKIKNDASNAILDSESLLEFASELGFEKRHLDFHYRSRHPYLIDFSNHAFYNQRLKPLPNNFDYVPIKFISVNGTYSDNSNDAEAETVLSIIEHNISRLPNGKYPSVGIATFNINQRNLILSKINDRRKFEKFHEFNSKIIELEENGFFVKNLENIQGDERDVIILSTTYGINKEGKFAQRFGSINHQKGYKLLNVIITRAKYKVYVCSSVPEEVYLNYKEYLFNEGSNNRRAVFFAYLAYSKAVSEQDEDAKMAVLNTLTENSTKSTSLDIFNEDLESPFEEEVYHSLIEHVDESKVIPQMRFAGFRIDIVYNPRKIGIPRIAIECDGAAYHSSQEAYLHDRHRQKILEKNGFVFHRIWSTNWWRNPKRETEKLISFIKEIENSAPTQFEDHSKIGLAFTDGIIALEPVIAKSYQEDKKTIQKIVKSVESENNFQQIDLFQNTVGLNSKVTVKYLNIDKDITVQLVDYILDKVEIKNGIQKINIKTPLGAAINGKVVGDTVKVGDLDRYVRILEIIN